MNTNTRQELTTASADTLHAAVRAAGWKPGDLRDEAASLEAGAHALSAVLPAAAVAPAVASMRAEADRLAEVGDAARAELDRRSAASAGCLFTQHGEFVGRIGGRR